MTKIGQLEREVRELVAEKLASFCEWLPIGIAARDFKNAVTSMCRR